METLLVVGVRNLGREIALHFARQGWQVLCAARTTADVEALARDVTAAGGRGVAVECDLVDPASLAPLAKHRIDLCVASQAPAGRFGPMPLLEMDDAELAKGFTTSVVGTWNLLKAVGPAMLARKGGTFVQMGTSSGVRTREGFAALGATQHALRALVQVAAREWRAQGVHVAYVPIDAPIESERSRAWAKGSGLGKLIAPDEIARACEYLHRQDPRGWTHELVLRPSEGDWTAPT
jgi:NAD(P)-dependent dehydrogenase (short-subunit alcohol dehydrogenase family)